MIRAFALVAALLSTAACTIEEVTPSELERLRVLGIRSDPPDLALGEQATLSALVFEPDDSPLAYAWSWCPLRGDAEAGYLCRLDEAELQAAWAELGTGAVLPTYDLGTGETATFDLVIDPELAFGLCTALTRDDPDPDSALWLCLNDFELSFELRVTTADDEVFAFRSVPVVDEEDPRNTNPDPTGDIVFSFPDLPDELAPGDPLRVKQTYEVTVDISPDQSETFVPKPEEGLPPPEPRLESLFLSWFVTTGEIEGSFDEPSRTSFVDGGSFDALLTNTWEVGREPGEEARLLLVLRDERGGIGWIEHDFGVLEAE